MKIISSLIISSIGFLSFAQQSQDLIPTDAVTVFSINNFSLLQKVSLDELVTYEFMEEIQAEIFDGSTDGKTIKESGIDFNQKLNVFYGKGFNYEVSGFTFGIASKKDLFIVFDDFQKEESPYPGVEFYSSYFNHLVIKNDVGVLIRVEPLEDRIMNMTDSIWYARGNDYPWDNYNYELEETGDYDLFELEPEESSEEMMEEIEESEAYYEELIIEEAEGDDDSFEVAPPLLPEAEEIEGKNYFELRDSVEFELRKHYLNKVCDELFKQNLSLIKVDEDFKNQLTHDADGVFYLDNSRNFQKDQSFWYMQTVFPGLYKELKELYTGNVMLGDIHLNDNNVTLNMEANYGEKLGSIYEKMNNAKFDKNVLKYIHKDNSAYFTYNVNLREAYEQMFEVIVPMLEKEKNPQIASNLLTLELLNEFLNKDAIFGTYKGSMFGSFNGIQKVKTKKIEFTYDEETFEYEEKEVEAEEDMPIFTIGFSTDRQDIPEKILKHLTRLTDRFVKTNDYWILENGMLDAAPLYFICKNGLFIVTNDEELAKNHSNGYGSDAISGKKAKEIKKNGFMYSEIDWGTTINKVPRDVFSPKQNEIVDAMRDKSGHLKLTSSKTTVEKTTFDLVYTFDGQYTHSGKYILDLINSIYVISK